MEERSVEEMVVAEREEREEDKAQRDDGERVEDEGEMRGEEGDSTERLEHEDSEEREYGGAKRARPGAPAFSCEHEMEIIEFVKDHAELYTKEHVHYVDKAKKDALWDEIWRRLETSGQDVGCRANTQGTTS